jgi:hypothetical protein
MPEPPAVESTVGEGAASVAEGADRVKEPPGRPVSLRGAPRFCQAALGQMMSLEVWLPATYPRGNFDPRFSLGLARAAGVPMRLSALCEQEMERARVQVRLPPA